MALIIGVSEGSRIYVDDAPVDILEAKPGADTMVVAFDVGGMSRTMRLTDMESREIFPSVFMSVGRSKKQDQGQDDVVPRVVIEAPRNIVILREELYERQRAAAPS